MIVSSSQSTHTDLETYMEFEDQCYILDITVWESGRTVFEPWLC